MEGLRSPFRGRASGATGPDTLGQLTRQLVKLDASLPWTRERMELALREVVRDVAGIGEFALDDDFVRDMKLD